MRTFKSCSLNNFRIHSAVLLSTVTTLCITSSGHIHLITESLHLLTTSIHSTYRSLPTSGQLTTNLLWTSFHLWFFLLSFVTKNSLKKMPPQPEWLLSCSRLSCAFWPFPIHLSVAPAFGLHQNLLRLLSVPTSWHFKTAHKRFWKPRCADALTQASPSVLGWPLHPGCHVQTLQ